MRFHGGDYPLVETNVDGVPSGDNHVDGVSGGDNHDDIDDTVDCDVVSPCPNQCASSIAKVGEFSFFSIQRSQKKYLIS